MELGDDIIRIQTVIVHQAVDLGERAGQNPLLATAPALPSPLDNPAPQCELEQMPARLQSRRLNQPMDG